MCSLISANTFDYSILKDRSWTSSDGRALNATLLKLTKKDITLKRSKDNKKFTLPLNKLSEDDIELLSETHKSFDKLIDSAENKDNRSYQPFVGFADASEQMWELAHRFGRARDVWNVMTQSAWGDVRRGSERIVILEPDSFKRVSSTEYYVHGEYISLKIRSKLGKINISGDKLIVIVSNEEDKLTIAERRSMFSPMLVKESLMGCSVERVGTTERLILTLEPIIR